MGDQSKVRYLKTDRGQYFYQRRVPQRYQRTLGLTFWRRPCGDVDYAKAVQLVVTWAEEHDELLLQLKNPDTLKKEHNKATRRVKEDMLQQYDDLGLPRFYEMTELRPGKKQYYSRQSLPRPWQATAKMMKEADASRAGTPPIDNAIRMVRDRVKRFHEGTLPTTVMRLPDYAPITAFLADEIKPSVRHAIKIQITEPIEPLNDLDYLDWLREAYDVGYSAETEPPSAPDDRDECDFIKRKLERKISELSLDPNTISDVLRRYCDFNSIRPGTRSKYRRDVSRLIQNIGNVPINHVRTQDLRDLRDQLMGQMKPASLHAVFTPIIGILSFAFDEDLTDTNPMAGVKLPKDKRPIEERKWKPFEPAEVGRILSAAETLWGHEAKGLSKDRREAILMVVRALTFTGMRPIEVIRLTFADLNDRLIRVVGSKTESSTRVLPLHPELAEFPDWVADGGLDTFKTIKTDRVGSVRHNFGRLIRKGLDEPITDLQKALYSLRSTFSNAMRRAGADLQVRRAILGHKEAGAIRHYDDGPEFDVKRKWVLATDPRK